LRAWQHDWRVGRTEILDAGVVAPERVRAGGDDGGESREKGSEKLIRDEKQPQSHMTLGVTQGHEKDKRRSFVAPLLGMTSRGAGANFQGRSFVAALLRMTTVLLFRTSGTAH